MGKDNYSLWMFLFLHKTIEKCCNLDDQNFLKTRKSHRVYSFIKLQKQKFYDAKTKQNIREFNFWDFKSQLEEKQ